MARAATVARATGAIRAGRRRGLIELRQSFTNGGDLLSHLLWPVLMLIVLYFLRDTEFGTGGPLLGTLALPSILGMNVAMGMVTMSQVLTAEREDGTLLRARATPNGMPGYLVGKVVTVSGGLLADLAILLIPGMLIIDGLTVGGAGFWLTLVWVLVLGMVATLPIGAILGSVFTSARGQGLIQLPVLGLIAISGVFYPLASMPEWLQWVAQAFPIYWLGLGMRSALLPDSAVAVEIGESWRHLETVGVLGAWAVVGLAVAPMVLRRMARRESGSSVAERREKALRRVG
ncbi:ABC transporter permease [Streptomyces sp. NPDC051662]|uniref:ABC transporter permease n=1 Tax=Streptomyces sp. NPDC051662 TaxID=3154750 RepID=UPI00342F5235